MRLFERGPGQGSTSLTAAGEALAEWSEKLLTDEAAAKKAFSTGERGEGSGDQTGTRGPHVTLHQIEVFLAATKHDSVRDASQSLGVTTQTIRNTMQDLERVLGENAQLFRSGTRLTNAGRILAERGERLLKDEAAMRSAVARAAGVEEENTVTPGQRRNAENALAAVEFIESHASAGMALRFPAALARALTDSLTDLGAGAVERTAFVLDLMQASVTPSDGLAGMLEPEGRAGAVFRERHAASEELHAAQVRELSRQRPRRSR